MRVCWAFLTHKYLSYPETHKSGKSETVYSEECFMADVMPVIACNAGTRGHSRLNDFIGFYCS